MEEDQTAQFISALAHLQPIANDELQTLDGWSLDQLKHEVIRLRRALAVAGVPNNPPNHVHHHSRVPPPGHQPSQSLGAVHDSVGVGVGHGVSSLPPPVHHQSIGLDRMGPPPTQELLPHLPAYGYVHQMSPVMQHHTPPQTSSSLEQHQHHHHHQHHPQQHQHHHHQPQQQQQQQQEPPRKRSFNDPMPMSPLAGGHAPPRGTKRPSRHDSGTGKRVERGRRVELQRAIRTKMRYMMGIGLEDDLPPPSEGGDVGAVGWVPSWTAGVGDARNAEWLDRVVAIFIKESTSYHQWNKVPQEDLEPETVKAAARTAFQNFAKRYLADVDPKQAKKQQKYVKNRRRWARKDLKQKRRAKAAQDPSFADVNLPQSALHIDYMSSEYSSTGEGDDEDETERHRRGYWLEMLRSRSPGDPSSKSGKGGWAEGVSEKVLEVRTPTWRSSKLDQIYRRLDTISAAQAAMRATPAAQQTSSGKVGTSTRLGHVAPSHQRFTLPPDLMRRGHAPRDPGEPWMWASGVVGIWPEPTGPLGLNANPNNIHHAEDVQRAPGNGVMDPNSVEALVEGWTDV